MLTEQIQAAIAKVNSTIATMEVRTQVKPGVTKVAKVNVVLGNNVSFGRIVNKRRQKAGLEIIEIQPRQWGKRIQGTPYVWHNGKLYLECLVLKTLSEKYVDRDGNEIQKQDVFSGGKAPEVHELGKDSPKWRTYKLESINSVKSKKIKF